MHCINRHLSCIIFASLMVGACSPTDDRSAAASDAEVTAESERLAFGGRLFDMWYDDIDTDFVPDDPETPAVDGSGGPNGDGTLNSADGNPIPNTGHDYRLKNLFDNDEQTLGQHAP